MFLISLYLFATFFTPCKSQQLRGEDEKKGDILQTSFKLSQRGEIVALPPKKAEIRRHFRRKWHRSARKILIKRRLNVASTEKGRRED